jgi:galactokinase
LIAFAPGRANLIGEHTDYNGGLALPFAIADGITVTRGSGEMSDSPYVRGVVAELGLPSDTLFQIESTLPQGAGVSSSAALTVALIKSVQPDMAVLDVARLGQKVENEYAGADTGLLDQLAILLGEPGRAVRIDFKTLTWETVPLELGDSTLALIDSGAQHALAGGAGYNERRAECRRAAELLGVETLSDATREAARELPAPLDRRALHVLDENDRVDATVRALQSGELHLIGALLDASHASLRDLYDASVPEVEATVERAKHAGATGARMMGGGFGGTVIALFPPDATPPADARGIRPSPGARLVV